MANTYEVEGIQVVEFHMMDKRKYFPLSIISGFTVRGILYPFSLIKTRLQVQKQNVVYKGTYDAFRKIVKCEGFKGLYRGFWISNLMIASQVSYITTYENVRQSLARNTSFTDNRVRSFIAGGCASMVGQTFLVPIDIVSQHLQMLSVTKNVKMTHVPALPISPEILESRWGAPKAVITAIYKQYGVRGFYKGYMASLATYAPNSALWWFFYDIYSNSIAEAAPPWVPRLLLQCVSAPLGGITVSVLTTPMDAIRARVQVENTKFFDTANALWKEEGIGIFKKGLSARLVQSITFSFFIILGYETIKRWSLLEEYKNVVRW